MDATKRQAIKDHLTNNFNSEEISNVLPHSRTNPDINDSNLGNLISLNNNNNDDDDDQTQIQGEDSTNPLWLLVVAIDILEGEDKYVKRQEETTQEKEEETKREVSRNPLSLLAKVATSVLGDGEMPSMEKFVTVNEQPLEKSTSDIRKLGTTDEKSVFGFTFKLSQKKSTCNPASSSTVKSFNQERLENNKSMQMPWMEAYPKRRRNKLGNKGSFEERKNIGSTEVLGRLKKETEQSQCGDHIEKVEAKQKNKNKKQKMAEIEEHIKRDRSESILVIEKVRFASDANANNEKNCECKLSSSSTTVESFNQEKLKLNERLCMSQNLYLKHQHSKCGKEGILEESENAVAIAIAEDRPELPETIEEEISTEEDMEMESLEPILVIEKQLFASDVSVNNGRFSIPESKIVNEFLSSEEKALLSVRTGNKLPQIEAQLIEPSGERCRINRRKWDMPKQNGKVSLVYNLVTSWNGVVKRNNLLEGMVVQLRSFREDSKLCFVLVKKS